MQNKHDELQKFRILDHVVGIVKFVSFKTDVERHSV